MRRKEGEGRLKSREQLPLLSSINMPEQAGPGHSLIDNSDSVSNAHNATLTVNLKTPD